jgi:outer membrane protein assembly factor BamD
MYICKYFRIMVKNLLYSVILLVTLASCSGFEKVRKSSDYNLKYRKAFYWYNKGDYNKSATLFDDISAYFRGTTKFDSISFYLAMSYYNSKDYILGAHYFSSFVQNFLYSPFTEEAEFLEAYCYYKESPEPPLDQANTRRAIESFQNFVSKRPLSKRGSEAQNLISELEDKLVEKSRLNAKLYYDLGYYKSSIIALKNSLDEYPNTKYREELMWLILDSNFKLAENSIHEKQKERYQATIDEYYSFISEYPEGKFKSDAEKIYKNAQKFVKE